MAGNKVIRLPDPSRDFRPEDVEKDSNWKFRVFEEDGEDPIVKRVFATYRLMHGQQCVDYVTKRNNHWSQFNRFAATIIEALELLNNFVDESDPDTNVPNIIHAFQTAERIRKEHPDLDWFHLTGLIHDLGKVMAIYGEPQWSTVGDTFPVGCAFAPSIVFRDSTFQGNPDLDSEKYNTKYGMYSPNCGLQNVMMSWSHDEYMYKVLKHNGTTLPQEALHIIRFHSFYPWHAGNDYTHLMDNVDEDMLPWIRKFNQFDLYTKKEEIPDIEALKPYYMALINKYCPGTLKW